MSGRIECGIALGFLAVIVPAVWAEEDKPLAPGQAAAIRVLRVDGKPSDGQAVPVRVHVVGQSAGQENASQTQSQTQSQVIHTRIQDRSSGDANQQQQIFQFVQGQPLGLDTAQMALDRFQAAGSSPLEMYLFDAHGGMDECTGAVLLEADSAVRTQLGLPEDRGLVVVRMAPAGPAAQIGLQPNDILLELAEKPLAKAEDVLLVLDQVEKLEQVVKSDKPIELKLLRSGKPLKIAVRPVRKLLLGSAEEPRKEYYIGTPATPIDETLRAHLDLPQGVGLVISDEVVPESPAAKAGLKKNDILLKFGDEDLKGVESLVTAIQKTQGKATAIVYLRKGEKQTAEITPAVRKEPMRTVVGYQMNDLQPVVPWMANPAQGGRYSGAVFMPQGGFNPMRVYTQPPKLMDRAASISLAGADEETARQLKDLSSQVEELKKTIAELRETLRGLKQD